MTALTLNSRPRPLRDESFRGYLLRLAEANGFFLVSDLVRPTLCAFPLATTHTGTRAAMALMSKLEPVLLLPKGRLYSHFKIDRHGLRDGDIRRTHRQYAVICSECLKQESMISQVMDNAMVTVCLKHRINLLERCPNCSANISLNRNRVGACQECGYDWATYESPRLEGSDPVLTLMRLLDAGKVSMLNLLDACDRVARPADFLPGSPNYGALPVSSVRDLQRQAAGLLLNKKYRADYREWLEAHHCDLALISPELATHTLDSAMRELPSLARLKPVDVGFRPPDYTGKAYRTDKVVTEAEKLHIEGYRLRSWAPEVAEVDLTRQVSAPQLSAILGLSQKCLKSLADARILPSLNVASTERHLLYCLNDVAALLRKLPEQRFPAEDVATLSDMAPELKLFTASFADLVTLVLRGEVAIVGGRGVADLEVSKAAVRRALHRFLVSKKGHLTSRELMAIWCASAKQVEALQAKMSVSLNQYSAAELMDDWVSLVRIAKLAGSKMKHLHDKLARAGIKPNYVALGAPHPLLLYKQSDELRSAFKVIHVGGSC